MSRTLSHNILGLVLAALIVSCSSESDHERALNTSNTIGAAWELRRFAESLEEGVNTRCYIAKFAAFKAKSLPQVAKLIGEYPSPNKESDTFAIKSVNEAMEIFQKNQVEQIAAECEDESSS